MGVCMGTREPPTSARRCEAWRVVLTRSGPAGGEPRSYCRLAAHARAAHELPATGAARQFASEDGTEVAVVQVHPDASSMELHMHVAREHITSAYEELLEETTSIQIFGELSYAAR